MENDIFIKHKEVSSIEFKFTLEPFVVESVDALIVIEKIMKSICFQTDKSLGYDPKKIIHLRKLDVNLSRYEAEEDEVLVALANSDFLEQVEDNGSNGSGSNMMNLDKDATEQRTEVPTPLKGEKSLKRHSTDTIDIEIDVSNKKARTFAQPIEVVSINEDDEGSINKGKGTIVEEEQNDQSQSVSKSERSSSHLALVESSKEPTMMIQRFTLHQAESSQFHSKEDLVKDFTEERNKSINENYKLM